MLRASFAGSKLAHHTHTHRKYPSKIEHDCNCNCDYYYYYYYFAGIFVKFLYVSSSFFLGYFAHSRRAQYFVYLMFTVRYFVFFYFEIFVPATTIARTTCRRLASSI